jgi:hypothetical protein
VTAIPIENFVETYKPKLKSTLQKHFLDRTKK